MYTYTQCGNGQARPSVSCPSPARGSPAPANRGTSRRVQDKESTRHGVWQEERGKIKTLRRETRDVVGMHGGGIVTIRLPLVIWRFSAPLLVYPTLLSLLSIFIVTTGPLLPAPAPFSYIRIVQYGLFCKLYIHVCNTHQGKKRRVKEKHEKITLYTVNNSMERMCSGCPYISAKHISTWLKRSRTTPNGAVSLSQKTTVRGVLRCGCINKIHLILQ